MKHKITGEWSLAELKRQQAEKRKVEMKCCGNCKSYSPKQNIFAEHICLIHKRRTGGDYYCEQWGG